MSGYGPFARYYDALTSNVDYAGRAAAFDAITRKYLGGKAKLVLDLACGTGSLSLELARLGCEVIGADASEGMLSVAGQKTAGLQGKKIMLLRQSMEELDLYGTVDAVICALDSVNHLANDRALLAAFQRVSLFTEPGGVFVFDANTLYKHREVLGCNAFAYDLPHVFCCWQNEFHKKTGRVDITLDFFEHGGNGRYIRETERFSECYFSEAAISGALEKTGFKLLETLDGDTFGAPCETSERIMYVALRNT